MSESLPELSAEELGRVEEAAAADGILQDPLGGDVAPTNDSTTETGTPEGDEAPGATEEDSFTKLDPNALPEELRPYYKSMQADHTRKTQEAAPWRKLGEELGVDSPDAIKQAVEFYAYLQDRNNLESFYKQLSSALGGGEGPGQPTAATQVPGVEDVDDLDVDPAVREMRAELEAMKSQLQTRETREQQEQLQWALIGEINRQDAMLHEDDQWKNADESEWNALYALSPAFEGDLIQTAQALDEFASARIAAFLNGKQTVQETDGVQPAPIRTAEQPRVITGEDDLELREAHKEALAFLRARSTE